MALNKLLQASQLDALREEGADRSLVDNRGAAPTPSAAHFNSSFAQAGEGTFGTTRKFGTNATPASASK